MTKPAAEAAFGSTQSYVEFWEMLQLHNKHFREKFDNLLERLTKPQDNKLQAAPLQLNAIMLFLI